MHDRRAVQVVTDVAALARAFDYEVTESTKQVGIGDRVRVNLNNRSVRGWVVGEGSLEGDLKPLSKWLGYGPPASLLGLLVWASERWCAPLSRFLIAASPSRVVSDLPVAPEPVALTGSNKSEELTYEPGVWQLAPTTDPLSLILGAYELCRKRPGSLLVLVPTESWARRLRGRLEQRGCAVASGDHEWDRSRAGWPVIVGSRGTALAPTALISGAVIIDADDEAYRSESTPTWNSITMLRERCLRDSAPLWATTIFPSPLLLDDKPIQVESDVASGWPALTVVDRRQGDPHDGILTREAVEAAHQALAGDEPVAVVVILQRLGTGRLFACAKCGELARCSSCGQAEEEVGDKIACAQRHEERPKFCQHCGTTNLKRVRVGVTTLARDVSLQLSQTVSEVSATTDPQIALERVVVGTEAVWQRVRRSTVVIFVDFDQYLLAPRDSARRAAVTAVGKAGRLVGARREARGVVVLQTRRGEDPVVRALAAGTFGDLVEADLAEAKLLGLAPYGARCEISGEAAGDFVAALTSPDCQISATPTGYVVRARDVATLTSALHAVPRPAGRLRLAVE